MSLLQRQLDRFPVSSVTLINNAGQNIGLFINLVCNRDVKADTNGARLPGHQSALSSLREFCSCWQTEVLGENVRLQGTNLNADGELHCANQHLLHHDTLKQNKLPD